ncbi:MAG: hypothetical protein HQ517_00740 [SAR324 cluster bacterium]|nr:hypothetical protein [SAR324 cluster bacterium]
MNQSESLKFFTNRYAVYGAVIGVCFPIIATVLSIYEHNLTFSFQGIIKAQILGAPFSFFSYIFPIFLGVIASIAGRYRESLADEVYSSAQSEEKLKIQRDELEVMIVTRTAELRKVQKQLIEANQRAGLTDIATKILHYEN